ncbi:phosphoribosylanthranilate isomerase [Chryseobacterium sp. Leaf404]|uniref:phosphoribosylanthranilate isomerase n=1 Tax=unclassified Chryseobacterium TaxID=2593645 RepID=UPI0006FBDA88|nr:MULTISPECIES: phosphoribosylanthranilate isomerase [unclassified Chryseobacterium]KQT18416.1 phosphoribosylanthranilate isomerase [Chryseobacterium sp. Leaf404]
MKSQKQEASRRPQVKVCGLTQLNQISELMTLKVDFLGFIFYDKSPRFVLNHLSLDQISTIDHQGKIGVFVNETVGKIVEISEKANLNFIQLHGDENEEYVIRLRQRLNENVKIIKVIRMGACKSEVENEIQKISNLTRGKAELSEAKPQISNLLFDTDSKAFGGTGKTFDWNILNEIKIPLPYFLSGGISLENVDEIKNLIQKPFVLDINSKFETEAGIKDLEKIKKLYAKL